MDRRYIIAGLFFIAAAIVGIVLVYPEFQRMSAAAQLVSEYEADFDAQNTLVLESGKLISDYKASAAEVAKVAAHLPLYSQRSMPELLIELEKLAGDNGLFLTRISFLHTEQGGADAKPYQIVNTQLSLKGSYRSFKNFAKATEKSMHLMDVALVSLIPLRAGEGEALTANTGFDISVSLNAYYQ